MAGFGWHIRGRSSYYHLILQLPKSILKNPDLAAIGLDVGLGVQVRLGILVVRVQDRHVQVLAPEDEWWGSVLQEKGDFQQQRRAFDDGDVSEGIGEDGGIGDMGCGGQLETQNVRKGHEKLLGEIGLVKKSAETGFVCYLGRRKS